MYVRIDASGGGRRTLQDRVKNYARGIAAEWEQTGRHFVQHNPEREKVSSRIQFLAPHLLRRHIGDSAQSHAWTGEMLQAAGRRGFKRSTCYLLAHGHHFRQPKIKDLGMSALGHENVRRLDVAVDNTLGVCRIERISDFSREREQQLQLERLPRDAVLQCQPVQVLHGDEGLPILLADVINRANVWVVQSGGGLRFALETCEGLRIASNVLGEKFQRY